MAAGRRVLVRFAAMLSATALVTATLLIFQPATVSDALNGSDFDPGNIISDSNFYDANAMSEADVQSFLDAKIVSCSNALCLNVLRVDTVSKSTDNMCPGGYMGAAAEPVSRIIFKVQQGCGISAKVILVTLQKEQSLVTSRGPTDSVLRKAMGYGCPDTASCDSLFYGIFNQIYQASRQLKRYGLSAPDNISFHYFPVGTPSSIKINPNDYDINGNRCWPQTVTIQNAATAALYYYTPYVPDAAALANLTGSGDGCSAYGNRNFWVYYNNWFGPPSYPPGSPEGQLYSIAVAPRAVHITGWAVDPSSPTSSVAVSVQFGTSWVSTVASNPDPNGDKNVPGAGQNHGIDFTIPASPGEVRVCVTFVNIGPGANVTYSCQFVTVPDYPSPVGAIESATVAPGSVALSGWAVRPDMPAGLVNVAANVGNNWYQLASGTADSVAQGDVPAAGPNQGFGGTISLPPGNQSVCIWATSTGGVGMQIACTVVVIPSSPAPVGAIETAVGSVGSISVNGWAVRQDFPTGLVNVAANIGNSWYQMTAGQPDSVAPTKISGAGPNQGYSGTVATTPGVKNLCIWASSTAGVGVLLSCQSVTVTEAPVPVGAIETTTVSPGSVTLSGWAVRPDAITGLVNVAANVGSNWYQFAGGQADSVAPTKLSGAGPNQGFTGTVALAPGSHDVCIWASSTAGVGGPLGCRTVNIPQTGAPVGGLESVTTAPGTVTLTGWAVRPEVLSGPVNVAGNIGSSWYQFTGGMPDTIAPTKVVGAGPNQGFSGTIATGSGVKDLCIWMTSSSGIGMQVICTTVTVP